MTETDFSLQWSNLLQHLGAWQGSFTRLSPEGELREDIPSLVTFQGLAGNSTIRQTLQYFEAATGNLESEKVLEYSSLSRSILFFDNGAFSQGSMQFSPLAEFGAEFGFIEGDCRLRLVTMFDTDSNLARITLIREVRQNTTGVARSPLSLDLLLGEWQGEAVTMYADMRSPDVYPTNLLLQMQGDRFSQKLTAPNFELASTATIAGSRLLFDQGRYPVQVLLLPGGASCHTPLIIPRHSPFLLEAGWLISDNLRQRLIRRYDERGGWVSLTLVTERKIS